MTPTTFAALLLFLLFTTSSAKWAPPKIEPPTHIYRNKFLYKKNPSGTGRSCFFMYGTKYCHVYPDTLEARVWKWRISGIPGNYTVKVCKQRKSGKKKCYKKSADCVQKLPSKKWYCTKTCLFRNGIRECVIGELPKAPEKWCESRMGVKFCSGMAVYDPRLTTGSAHTICYMKKNLAIVCIPAESPKPSPSPVPIPDHVGRYLTCADIGCFTGARGGECICNTRMQWQVRSACMLFGKANGIRCAISEKKCLCSLGLPPPGGCHRFKGYSFAQEGMCYVRKDKQVCDDEWQKRHDLVMLRCTVINGHCACRTGVQSSCALTYGHGCYTRDNHCYCSASLQFNTDCSKFGTNCLLQRNGVCDCVDKQSAQSPAIEKSAPDNQLSISPEPSLPSPAALSARIMTP